MDILSVVWPVNMCKLAFGIAVMCKISLYVLSRLFMIAIPFSKDIWYSCANACSKYLKSGSQNTLTLRQF